MFTHTDFSRNDTWRRQVMRWSSLAGMNPGSGGSASSPGKGINGFRSFTVSVSMISIYRILWIYPISISILFLFLSIYHDLS